MLMGDPEPLHKEPGFASGEIVQKATDGGQLATTRKGTEKLRQHSPWAHSSPASQPEVI